MHYLLQDEKALEILQEDNDILVMKPENNDVLSSTKYKRYIILICI